MPIASAFDSKRNKIFHVFSAVPNGQVGIREMETALRRAERATQEALAIWTPELGDFQRMLVLDALDWCRKTFFRQVLTKLTPEERLTLQALLSWGAKSGMSESETVAKLMNGFEMAVLDLKVCDRDVISRMYSGMHDSIPAPVQRIMEPYTQGNITRQTLRQQLKANLRLVRFMWIATNNKASMN